MSDIEDRCPPPEGWENLADEICETKPTVEERKPISDALGVRSSDFRVIARVKARKAWQDGYRHGLGFGYTEGTRESRDAHEGAVKAKVEAENKATRLNADLNSIQGVLEAERAANTDLLRSLKKKTIVYVLLMLLAGAAIGVAICDFFPNLME